MARVVADHYQGAISDLPGTGLLLTLKNEIVRLAPRGRVNLVHPGWVVTPMAAEALDDAAMVARATSTMALRKVATPEDVAAAIAQLRISSSPSRPEPCLAAILLAPCRVGRRWPHIGGRSLVG